MAAMESDEELMKQYQAGKVSAFDTLYEKYRGDVYRYLLRQFDPGTAEELYQDVWMKLIQARDRYQPSAKFRTYLYTITHNRIRDHFRRHHETPVDSTKDSVEVEIETLAPERITQDRQAIEVLLKGIRLLPGEQRQAFLLKEESGLSVEEIAEIMGASRESTRSRLRYAMSKLRNHLKGIWP
jgi:RNA polymerase sigma-70 factor (ECF subfamily)